MNHKNIMENQVETKIKTGHDYLREMCAFEADHSAYASIPRHNPMTNRVEYIMHQLTEMNVPFEQDTFDCCNVESKEAGKFNYININVLLKGKNETETVIFSAHTDVNRKNSENAQDNTASICNLLDLISQLKDKELERNVLISFVDAEEVVDTRNSGSARLAYQIKQNKYGTVIYSIILELTGLGKNVWVTAYSKNKILSELINLKATFKPTPFSDCYTLFANGIEETVCIGILPDNEIRQPDMNKIHTWRLCHQEEDTFDKCSKEDMAHFVENILLKLI